LVDRGFRRGRKRKRRVGCVVSMICPWCKVTWIMDCQAHRVAWLLSKGRRQVLREKAWSFGDLEMWRWLEIGRRGLRLEAWSEEKDDVNRIRHDVDDESERAELARSRLGVGLEF